MVLFYVLIVCTVTLPPGVNPIAVDKYIYLTAVSMFIRLWCMDNKISWLGGWSSHWHPPQGLSEQKPHDNAATTVIQTARTLEAEWWQVCGEACVWGKGKMSQVLGAFGLLDFTMLWPVLAWRAFLNLRTVYFFNFPNFFFRLQPTVDNWNCVYSSPPVCVCVCVCVYIYIYIHTYTHTHTHTHTTWQNLTYISALSVGSHPRGELGVTGRVGAHL